LLASVQTDVAFFVNSCVLSLAAAIFFTVDVAVDTSVEAYQVGLLVVPILLSWLMYRAASEAAVRWGDVVRATYDIYRLPLYRQLGVTVPGDPEEERLFAEFVNRCLWFGEPLPWAVRSEHEPPPISETGG
jgi:hypothetical protein